MPDNILISIVIPVLNEAEHIEQTLRSIDAAADAAEGVEWEVIVVDGRSTDNTAALATPLCGRVLTTPPGRGLQLAAGAQVARGDFIWFLHGDTRLEPAALTTLHRHVCRHATSGGQQWGRFDVRLSGSHWLLRVVERMLNLRSRLTGIATGDQGIFVHRDALAVIGGVPQQVLMEDIELSARLLRLGRPLLLPALLTTSSRRWERRGMLPTIGLMWSLRLAYGLGIAPERLLRWYR